MDWRSHRKSLAYADFYQRADVEGMLCIHLDEEEHGAPGQAGIVLARAISRPTFDTRELETAIQAARPLRLALRRARRLEALERESAAARALLGDRAVLTTSTDARLIWAAPNAERLAEPFIEPGGLLRDPLRSAVKKLVRMAQNRNDDLGVPVQVELSAQPLVTAELWMSRDARGESVVGIELRSPNTTTRQPVLRGFAARFGLTPTEACVLLGLGDALSNREIARQLSISVETARTYVAHVLSKLGARSRVEAALMLAKAGTNPS
jgi:DNA-binding CsgD family transcriptional regulator